MIINKVFNNNVALIIDPKGREYVVMGRGITFSKKVGDNLDEKLIEKTFILKKKEASERFKLLLEDIPGEQVSICYDIIEYAKNFLDVKLSDYVYVTLTDHIHKTLRLYDEGIKISNPLIWEIKKFYPKEYSVGLKALEYINEEFGKEFPIDEAGNIALHLVNAEVNSGMDNFGFVYDLTKKVQDILNIVKYTFGVELDDTSLDYERFLTHLRYFFKRLEKGRKESKEEDVFLLEQIKVSYKESFACMQKVEEYLDVELSNQEKLYLTVHIQRITS